MRYVIKGISHSDDSWIVNLLVKDEHAPCEIAALLHPHASFMATGVVTDGPEKWIERILVLTCINGKKTINDWKVGEELIDSFI